MCERWLVYVNIDCFTHELYVVKEDKMKYYIHTKASIFRLIVLRPFKKTPQEEEKQTNKKTESQLFTFFCRALPYFRKEKK